MGDHKTSIEINGKLYDAATGKPLVHTPKTHSTNTKHTGKAIDGVVRTRPSANKTHTTHHQPKHQRAEHQTAPHQQHHKPQKSQTLMRQAVTKPFDSNASKTSANVHSKVDPGREERARASKQSAAISKFKSGGNAPHKTEKPLDIQPEPQSFAPGSPAHHTPHKAHAASSANERLVAEAVGNAHAHEAKKKKRDGRSKRLAKKLGIGSKTLNVIAVVLAIALLSGFFVYQNIPNLSMRLASQRAGFAAKLPKYQPSGFELGGPIEYSAGKVTVTFESNSDERDYSLTQQVSNWNSESLVNNYLEPEGKQYQTSQDSLKGKTVYLYDDSNATWVSGGVWYTIDGHSNLSGEQLLNIANSI